MERNKELIKHSASFGLSIGSMIIVTLILLFPIEGFFPLANLVNMGGIYRASSGADHPIKNTIKIDGIDGTVTILRDTWGIPHIYGISEKDLSFGLGICHAQDRLFQMDIIIRTGMGLMSEIMGVSSLSDDIYFRKLGLTEAAEELLDVYEKERNNNPIFDEAMNNSEAYCQGVNTIIEQKIKSNTLPPEFHLLNYQPTEWTPLKALVYNRIMSLMLSYNNRDILATLIYESFGEEAAQEIIPTNSVYQIPVVPEYGNYSLPSYLLPAAKISSENSAMLPTRTKKDHENLIIACKDVLSKTPEMLKVFQQSWIGSNNWVVNGTKTTSGKPILCNDMHLPITLPHIWYEAHMVSSESGLNVYGYTLAGTPLIVIGYNTHVAWGATIVASDSVDWFEYIWNPNNDDQYLNRNTGSWKNIREKTIEIPVRNQPNHTETISYTDDGVILTESGKPLAMKWTATVEPTYEYIAFHLANRAKNWAEFNESMQFFKDPAINIVFADIDGTISLRPTGRFIKRSYFGEGLLVQNGSNPSTPIDWEYIPFNKLPLSVDPPQNYLASANQKSTGPDYQYYITSFQAEGYRARAINRVLREARDGSIDVEFMKDLQCEAGGILDTCAESFVPFFDDAISGVQLSEVESAAQTALENWQSGSNAFLMRKNLVAPTIYAQTMERYREYVWEDDYTNVGLDVRYPQDNTLEYLTRISPNSRWFDDVSTDGINETRDDIIIKAFKQAILDLSFEFSDDTTTWLYGSYHQIEINHLAGVSSLSRGPFPHDGSVYTLLAAGGRTVDSGPSERMIIDLNNQSNCLSVIPTGASGHPASSHYFDQFDLWINCEYHPMLIQFDSSVAFPRNYLESTLILQPI
ncbi:MAG: penicillin acylase family protein [Candidatus Hodarchaeales archaeon]